MINTFCHIIGIAFTTGAIISYSAFKYMQTKDGENMF